MSAKDLEAKIRERARIEHKKAIEEAFQPALRAVSNLGVAFNDVPGIKGETGLTALKFEPALVALRTALIAATNEAAGDKAIDAFVRKVDGLQDQIDELRDSVA